MLSFLKENNVQIHLANQKSFFVSCKKKEALGLLQKWCHNKSVGDLFVVTALSKFNYSEGQIYTETKQGKDFSQYAEHLYAVEKQNTFQITIPPIVSKIKLGLSNTALNKVLPLENLPDFVIGKIAKHKTKYLVKDALELLFEADYVRFIKVKTSTVSLWLRNRNGDEIFVIDHIKILNDFCEVLPEEIDYDYYKTI